MLAQTQARIAEKLGDDILAAQCRLYSAEALIQLGARARAAAIIARERARWRSTPAVLDLCRALEARLASQATAHIA